MRERIKDFIGNYLLFPIASGLGAFLVFCLKRYEAHQLVQANEQEDERDWNYFENKETTLGGLENYERQMTGESKSDPLVH